MNPAREFPSEGDAPRQPRSNPHRYAPGENFWRATPEELAAQESPPRPVRREKFWRATPEQLAAQNSLRPMTRQQITGRRGERIAERYYIGLGAKLLERNYFIRYGEIDLIFEHEQTIIAVEVKTRGIEDRVSARESILYPQLRRIARALLTYAQDNDLLERPLRIDVYAITTGPDGSILSAEHIPNVYEG
jgi:putative endonuclease